MRTDVLRRCLTCGIWHPAPKGTSTCRGCLPADPTKLAKAILSAHPVPDDPEA